MTKLSTTFQKVMNTIGLVLSLSLLASCATVSPPDDNGFRWFKARGACELKSIDIVEDISQVCSKGACACTHIWNHDNSCIIFLPKKAHPDLLKHELRHTEGWMHLANPGVVCPAQQK